MTADCVFCRIARREIAAHIVHEDDRLVAFLDGGPIRPGHTQIVPRDHFPCFDEAPSDVVCAIAHTAQKIAKALKRLYRVPRVAFFFTGADIAHVHAHVVPMLEKTDITSRRYIVEDSVTFRAMPQASEAELASSGEALRAALAGLG